MNYWLVVGGKKNWEIAFNHGNIWGLRETQKHLWDSLQEEDELIFYATTPIVGVIGHGIVRTKMKQTRPLWPDEIKKNEVIWPLRFEFDVKHVIQPDDWEEKRIENKALFPRAGFQPLNPDLAQEIIKVLDPNYYSKSETVKLPIVADEPKKYETMPEKTGVIAHDKIKKLLLQMGKLQKFIAEEEYVMEKEKLDVVWRRVEKSVPTYVFEVQVGGDIHHALGKLKHSFDLWNSHIFLVASDADNMKASVLLSGTFHEINNRVKLIDISKIEELYNRKKAYFDMERELGIN